MRVMRILTRPNLGGPMRQAIALWHEHARAGVATLLVTGCIDADEAAIDPRAEGVPRVAPGDVRADHPGGWCELPALGRGVGPWRDLRAARALRDLLAAFAPDVVHTHMSKAGWLGRRAARAARVPVVAHTFHGHVLADYFGRVVSRGLCWLERRLARRTDLLFAVSASCADELAALGVAPRARFRVVPPAVAAVVAAAADRGAARARLGAPEDAWLLAAVGRLVPIKRPEHFLQLLRLLPEATGHVFGSGPLAATLRASGQALGERLHLHGAAPDVRACLPAFDALVLTSRREGWPLVAVEAAAAGVPVVGYDVPGIRDALADGRGVLVPEAAGPAGLAAALRALRAEPGRAGAIVAAAAQGVAAHAPARVAAALLDAYRDQLQAARPAPGVLPPPRA